MGNGYQKVILMGNLTKDPEYKITTAGTPVCKFTLAVNEFEDKVQFINCVAWKKLAEVCGEYLKKGKACLVDGRIENSSWEDDKGKHYKTDVVLSAMKMIGSKEKEEEEKNYGVPDKSEVVEGVLVDESDIPF